MYTMGDLEPEVEPTRDGFLGRVLDADRAMVAECYRKALEDSEEFRFEARVERRDGTLGWVRGLGRVTLGEDGSPLRMGGTIQDITEAKEVELKLVDAVILNALMQVMASAANESQNLAEALAASRQQLLSHHDWTRAVAFTVVSDGTRRRLTPLVVDEADPTQVPSARERQVAEEVLRTRATVFEEVAVPRAPAIGFSIGGATDPMAVVVITADSPFERHAMLHSMVEQVAHQLARVAERELSALALAEARDAAMEASRLTSRFLATMSHEIRTPMNGVIGLNELLLRSGLEGHQRRLAEGVQVAGQALLGLINDILDFSKIEAGQLEIEAVEFDVPAVFERVADILSSAAREKGIELLLD